MVVSKTLIWGAWFCGVWMSVASAEADDRAGAPRSLRMRSSGAAATHGAPSKRVGQAAPADPPPDADTPPDASAPPDPSAPFDVLAPDEPIAAPGLAQAAPPAPAPPVAAPPVAAPDPAAAPVPGLNVAGDEPGERRGRGHHAPAFFTVTGSLIERATLTTPSPLTILRRDELLGSGRSMIGDILQGLPEQGDALNAQNNNGGDGSTRINLRALGIARTLTLVNGRRFVVGGTGADTSVDTNTIPLAMIDRVEVLKDAGSAVYGSDAVGGVVNILTRDHFHGTEASLYTAETERKDGFTFDASIITGHRTADGRGNIVFSAGTQRQEPVFAGDRDFSKVTKSLDFLSGTTFLAGSSSTPNGRLDARQTSQGQINACGAGVRFCTNDGHGGFRPFILPTATSFGDNFNFQPDNLIYTPSARANAFTTGSYKLTPGVEGFFEASFMHRSSHQRLASTPLITSLFGLTISRNSIYNPFGVDLFSLNRRLQEFGPREFLQSVDTLRTVVGMRGSAPESVSALDGWKWELSFNYGRTDATQKATGNLVLSRVRNAIGPSFIDPFFGPTCGTPFAPIPGCVPMNLLGPAGSISPEAVKYAGFTGLDVGVDNQLMALATAHGRIATLPGGGDIALAISADARKDTGEFTPDALTASGDTTGAVAPSITGSVKAQEAAAELSIVPVRDRDGVERLELDLAARAFRYDTFGEGTSTTARALVRPIRGITLRASQSTAFRAPSVGELFQAKADSFPLATDPCDSLFGTLDPMTAAECAREGVPPNSTFGTSQQHAVVGGNPQVKPESAKVRTVGVVLESPRAKGLSLSVDWWNIDVTQAIQVPLIQNVFANCYQRGIPSFCDLIRRDPITHEIATVDLRFSNFGGTSTSGVDAAVNFDHHIRGGGDLHTRFELQQLQSYDVDTGFSVLHGLGVYDLGIHPKRQASLFAMWRHPHGAAAGFNFHFVDSFLECDGNNCNDASNPSRTVESYSKLDVFSSITFKQLGGETTITVGVNNVFDRQPPVIFNGAAGNYDESAYDFLGRFAYARLTQSF